MDMISQQKIDEIKNAADIVEVVGEYVQLQPAGKNLKGLCPFHQEKTPSFFVSPEKKTFHCFGCGENGNAIGFLQKYKRMSFPEALKTLADRYHIALDYTGTAGPDDKAKRLYEITEAATGFYSLALTNLASGKPALEYLRKRGLDVHTAQYFELGLAPDEFDALYQALKPKYQELDLLELGLIKKTAEGAYYDLFRDRIIFPIRNEYGKTVGYSGRLFRDSHNEPNKYVNSPFTTIFTKGENLYNLDRAQPAIRTAKRAILYEGFMDVIASVRAGLKEAVASMGTNLTPEQAKLLKKYTDRVILCYDGDSAGFEAMERAIPLLEAAGLEVRLLLLPEELDPDDYTKKYSSEAYAKYFEANQIDKYEFRYRYLRKHADFRKAAEVERFKVALFGFLLREDSATVQELYLQTFAKDAGVSPEVVMSDWRHFRLSKALTHQLEEKKKTRMTDLAILDRFNKAERILVSYYAKAAEYRRIIREELGSADFAEDGNAATILTEIGEWTETSEGGDFLPDIPVKCARIAYGPILDAKIGEFTAQELTDCIMTLKERGVEKTIALLRDQAAQAEDNAERTRILNEIVAQKNKKGTFHGKKGNREKAD